MDNTTILRRLETAARRTPLRNLLNRLLEKSENRMNLSGHSALNAARILRFLKGYLSFKPRNDDTYVVSYPRSGTTWMQFMLYQLTTDGDMHFSHLNEVSPWFERALAQGTMTAADFEAYRSPRILKSHLLPHWLPATGRFIYMVRNPLDVAYSYYRFYCSHLQYTGTLDKFMELFSTGNLQYGPWSDHTSSWEKRMMQDNVLIVHYESLLNRFEETVHRVSQFCNIKLDASLYDRVQNRCRFDYMKTHEKKFDHVTALLIEKGIHFGSFIREGRSGQGTEHYTEAQKETLLNRIHASTPRSGLKDLGCFLH